MNGNPLLVANNDTTSQGTREDIVLLKTCDDVITYFECGWFCVTGWKDEKRLVHAHFNSEEEYRRMVNPRPFDADAGGPRPRGARRFIRPDGTRYPVE